MGSIFASRTCEQVREEYSGGYEQMLEPLGATIFDQQVFGSYQGDEVYILQRAEEWGLSVIGYGSCSGCDALQAVEPFSCYGDNPCTHDWSGVESLGESIRNEVRWFASREALRDYVHQDRNPDWYWYDDEITAWLRSVV